MEYSINMEPENRFVLVELTGSARIEDSMQMTRDALVFGEKTGCSLYLVDSRKSPTEFSTIDTFQFMTGLENLGVSRNTRVAVVYAQDHAKHRFAENVAVNRGWSIRYFEDFDEASRWLESGIEDFEGHEPPSSDP